MTAESHRDSWLEPCLPAHRVTPLPQAALDLKDKGLVDIFQLVSIS